jgi:hypothetical protein
MSTPTPFEITGSESAKDLVQQLVALRLFARWTIRLKKFTREQRERLELIRDHADPDDLNSGNVPEALAKAHSLLVDLRFEEIKIGRYLIALCHELDEKATPDAVFDAIETNVVDRHGPEVRKYGAKASIVINVLNLENSATKCDESDVRPLAWCYTMAFMNELQTNRKFDRVVHDEANDFFDGAFGEFHERPLLDRLAGRSITP